MQYPCLNDMAWRDENVSTLNEWHPCFHSIHPELMQVVEQLNVLFTNYLDYMKRFDDEPVEDLITHIEEEALTYFCNAVLAELHKQRELNTSDK